MKLKKVISSICALAMLTSISAVSVNAEGTALTTYGFSEDLSGNKFIKWDGNQYSANPTTIPNVSIINLGDKLGVFSHPTNSYYFTYSNTVRACLMNRSVINGDNTTSTGYSVASKDGQAIISPENQILSAKKDGVDNYIPIVDTYELSFLDSLTGYEAVEAGVKVDKNATNVGFRGYDEKCTTIAVPAGTTLSNATRVQTDNIAKLNAPKTTLTVEFDVLVSGDVDAEVYCDSNKELMQINSDATVTYPVFKDVSSVNWTKTAADYPTEAWHHAAITYDYAGCRIMTYMDGKLLSANGWYIGTIPELNSLRLGVKNGTYTDGGYVAYDNLKISRGYYVARDKNVELTPNETVYSIDSNNGIINIAYGTTIDSLKAALISNTNASKVQVYEDPSKAVSAMLLDDMSVVTLVAPDKVTYKDYTVAVAEPSAFQAIGLSVSDEYPKGYYYKTTDGVVEKSTPTPVDNCYVEATSIDGADTLAVYSNSNQNEYTAYGWRVIETLTSANGYDLSIWDSTKTVLRSTPDSYDGTHFYGRSKTDEVVDGDYLKAEKDGEVIWVPIVNKTNVVVKNTPVDKGGSATEGDVSSWGLTSKVNGFGIKDSSDSLIKIASTTTSGNVQIGANQSKVIIPEYEAYSGANTVGVYTWAVNIYPSEGASFEYVTVYNTGGAQSKLFTYNNGKAIVNNPNTTTTEYDFAPNRWHRVAISTDPNRHVLQMWIDGQNILSVGTQYLAMLFCTRFNILGTNKGDIYFDDIMLSKGYYDVDSEFTTSYADANMVVKADGIKYRNDITLDDILNATNAANIKFFSDNLETETTDPSIAKTAVLYSENGLAYQYMTVDKCDDEVTFKVSGDGATISATATYKAPIDEVAALAEYEDGRLVGVKFTQISASSTVYASTAYTEGNTYKLIILSDVDNLIPTAPAAEYIGQ